MMASGRRWTSPNTALLVLALPAWLGLEQGLGGQGREATE